MSTCYLVLHFDTRMYLAKGAAMYSDWPVTGLSGDAQLLVTQISAPTYQEAVDLMHAAILPFETWLALPPARVLVRLWAREWPWNEPAAIYKLQIDAAMARLRAGEAE